METLPIELQELILINLNLVFSTILFRLLSKIREPVKYTG